MPLPPPPVNRPSKKEESELLFKGVTCALIGAIVLVAPYIARSSSVGDMMREAYLAGWFAVVLGGAFLVRYGLRRYGGRRRY